MVLRGTRMGDYFREMIFQTSVMKYPGADLKDVTQFGVNTDDIENVVIPTSNGEVCGWFMTPKSVDISIGNPKAVLYVHGVKGNRAGPNRVGLYNVLLKLGIKVLAFDYRGFGDSSKISLDEDTVVEDAMAAYDWLTNRLETGTELMVFAHSMGTAIASHSLAKLHQRNENFKICGLILMSPFNFTEDIVSIMTSNANFVKKTFINILFLGTMIPSALLKMTNMEFRQDVHLSSVPCPVQVLHAEDDPTIPLHLAQKLVDTVIRAGKLDVEIHMYHKSLGHAHSHIYKDEGLPQLILNFFNKCKR